MPTFKDMVDEVRANLAGYTLKQDRITYVSNPTGISSTDVSITIGSSNNLAKGVIEIDDELIYIDSFDKTSSTLNVIPGFGRGYSNTSPSPHSLYSQVILSPTFPRVTIKNAINDTINSVFPKLWSIRSTTFTFDGVKTSYALPDDCESVIDVTWESVGPSKEWIPVERWRMDGMANAASFNSSTSISIYDAITPGRTVQVWYQSSPSTLTSNSDDYSDVTGLPETSKDVIILGASYRLMSYIDAGRVNLTSAESDMADTKMPSQAGVNASKYLYALYQQRLNEEASRLLDKYPIRPHYIR